jgi:hypothetical protein
VQPLVARDGYVDWLAAGAAGRLCLPSPLWGDLRRSNIDWVISGARRWMQRSIVTGKTISKGLRTDMGWIIHEANGISTRPLQPSTHWMPAETKFPIVQERLLTLQ